MKIFHPESEKISPNNYINNNSLSLPEKESKKKKPEADPFKDPDLPEDLLDALHEFEAMRNTIKAPMTPKAKTLLLSKLRKMSKSTEEQIQILNQSVERSWRGIFPLKDDMSQAGRTEKPQGSFYRIEEHKQTEKDVKSLEDQIRRKGFEEREKARNQQRNAEN